MGNRLKQITKSVLGKKNYDYLKYIYLDEKKAHENKELLQKRKSNIQYKDTHLGERCFVLGNGPSLRDVDLELLKDEFVISVNNFSQVANYELARTNLHLWMDFSFFELREDQKYDHDLLIENYKLIGMQEPICFVPENAYGFIMNNKLDQILDINYISLTSSIVEDPEVKIDIAKYINSYSTVVQYAIVIAIYMGFKEIYLLGCDSTNIISLLNCAMNISNVNMHAYDNDDVDERYKELLQQWTMSDVFFDQYNLFFGYKALAQYCSENNIELFNASTNTLINEIKRIKLDSVIKEKK